MLMSHVFLVLCYQFIVDCYSGRSPIDVGSGRTTLPICCVVRLVFVYYCYTN